MNQHRDFLAVSDVVDWQDTQIVRLAAELAENAQDDETIARRTFEWVRDNIEHSVDCNRSEVTCRASDVLKVGTGFCYAKSHLLAALMRANGVPCGFCYQRLSMDGKGSPYCLHGLNAVFLKRHGWYRVDARGNTDAICADFTPPLERLAFVISAEGEADLPEMWPEPLPLVVNALRSAASAESLSADLPDITDHDATQ